MEVTLMPAPGFLSDVVLWPWFLPYGEARTVTLDFVDGNGDPTDPGTVTVDAGAAWNVHATVTGTGSSRTVTWSSGQTVALADGGILGGKWRLRIDGVYRMGGAIRSSSPTAAPTAGEWTVALPSGTGTITVTITGGATTRATYRIPFEGRWNCPLLADQPWLFPVFMIGCSIADISPVPPSVSATPARLIAQVLVSRIDGAPPADPVGFGDIPAADAWTIGQDLEEADIYGALLLPLPYIDSDPDHPYPFDQPIWYRGRSVDGDGFETNVYMYLPNGIGATPGDVDVVFFADGVRTEYTIPAPPDDTTTGEPVDMTVTFRAVGTGPAAAAKNVDARMAAIEARLTALEA